MRSSLTVTPYGNPDKPVLLLLHPVGTLHQIWLPLIHQLEDNYYMLAPDLIYEDLRLLSFPNFIQDIIQLVPPYRQIHAVGVGIGAELALCLSAQYPDKIASQTLIGAALDNTEEPYRRLRWLIQALPESWLIRFQLAGMHYMDNESQAALLAGMRRLGKAGLLAQIDAYQSYVLEKSLRSINVPTLLFYGELDQSSHLQDAQFMLRELPIVSFELAKRAGCGACFDAQEYFVRVLLRHVMAYKAMQDELSSQITRGDVVHTTS